VHSTQPAGWSMQVSPPPQIVLPTQAQLRLTGFAQAAGNVRQNPVAHWFWVTHS
jgi:hypothetical protein